MIIPLTENEAAEKWCPQFQVTIAEPLCHNRDPYATSKNCIGQECMWWRWVGPDEAKGYCGGADR